VANFSSLINAGKSSRTQPEPEGSEWTPTDLEETELSRTNT
jgi:hypothetical protein